MSEFEVYYSAGQVLEGEPANAGLSADDLPGSSGNSGR